MSVLYRGVRVQTLSCRVTREEGGAPRPLPLRRDLRDHSPNGFEWGYEGSGPAQLALALLADALEDDEVAEALHQAFKRAVVGQFPYDGWTLTADEIRAWRAAYARYRGWDRPREEKETP